jgi:hypothetical protein
MKKPTEDDLIQAALAIGQAAAGCSPEEREQIKKLYEQVKTFADSQQAKGISIDKSAFFAAGLLFHPQVESSAVKEAAVKYIDLDVLFVKEMESTAT